tara:strand:- start:975 stop:1115 length:141 start_codon:yes stop_codon:yes gene_type:complete
MTFVEACELLTEILVGKKKPVSRKKTGVKSVTNSKTRRRYQRRKQK